MRAFNIKWKETNPAFEEVTNNIRPNDDRVERSSNECVAGYTTTNEGGPCVHGERVDTTVIQPLLWVQVLQIWQVRAIIKSIHFEIENDKANRIHGVEQTAQQ